MILTHFHLPLTTLITYLRKIYLNVILSLLLLGLPRRRFSVGFPEKFYMHFFSSPHPKHCAMTFDADVRKAFMDL
jgi:hypothetical protein